jgi:Arc/MetJ-type ribon-helix-helix transcriptional regulator
MVNRNIQATHRISIRITDSDVKKVKFIMKSLGKNQSEAIRESINYLYNGLISGNFKA